MWPTSQSSLTRGLIAVALACSGLLAMHDFFGRWASAPQLYEVFSQAQVQLAQRLEETVPPGANLYITPRPLSQVATQYTYWSFEYLLGAQRFNRRFTFDGEICQMFPPRSAEAAYILSDDPAASTLLRQIYPTVKEVGSLPHLEVDTIPAGQAARPIPHGNGSRVTCY